jgi:beta-lactamase regulating signal transducer with metallopeptidase domain/Flp pilus assembly protein TadD
MELFNSFLTAVPFPPEWVLVFVKASLLLGVAQLALKAMPSISAATRHLVLTTALAAFLLIPVFGYVVPAWQLRVLPPASRPAAIPAASSEPVRRAVQTVVPAALPATQVDPPGVVTVVATPTPAPAAVRPARSWAWSEIAIFVWLTIAALLLARLFLGMLRVSWIISSGEPLSPRAFDLVNAAKLRLGITRAVSLVRSNQIQVPMIWGCFRPALLLPMTSESWPEEQLEVVILHELGHLKRWDFVTLVIGNLVTSLFWFHPQVWLADLTARRECERACDDLVLTSGTKASDYAGHLLSFVKLMPAVERFGAVTLGMSRRSQLEGRLLAILHPSLPRASATRRGLVVGAVAAAAIILPLSALRLTAAPPQETAVAPAVLRFGNLQLNGDSMSRGESANELVSNRKEKDRDWRDGGNHSASEWFAYAYELHNSDRFPEAIAAFKNAIAGGYKPGTSAYNIACGYAMQNDADNALIWLRQSLVSGFDNYDHLFEDSDLDPIRGDARFQAVLAPYRADYEKEHNDHDSWKGTAREWKSAIRDGIRGGIREGILGGIGDLNDLQGLRSSEDESPDRLQEANRRFALLQSTSSTDGEDWSDTGVRLLRVRQLDRAIVALRQAVDHLGESGSTAMYNLACAYSLNGDRASALQWLEKSINAGFDQRDKINQDPDLNTIRREARFAELAKLADDLTMQREEWSRDGVGRDDDRDWSPVIDYFRGYVRAHPGSGRAFSNLGYALLRNGSAKEAVDAFQSALRLGYRPGASTYNVACALAVAGQKDAAFDWLARADRAGFKVENYVGHDDDLDNLRDDPRLRQYEDRSETWSFGKHEKHDKVKMKRTVSR